MNKLYYGCVSLWMKQVCALCRNLLLSLYCKAPLRLTGRNDSESLLRDFPGVWVHFLVQIRLALL